MDISNDLQIKFEESALLITNCGRNFDNDTLLKLYGYYKQSIYGDCNTVEPSYFSFKEKAKWTAWNNCKSLKKQQAVKQYIKLVNELLTDAGDA
jgi:acyl-CoA-binding protein